MKANFALFLLIIFTGAAVTGWKWPDIAKIMPVYVAAIPGLIMISIQLFREMTGWESVKSVAGMDMDQVSVVQLDIATERRRTLLFFAWFIGGALGIWLLGIVITLPVLVFLYALVEGGEKWFIALVMAVCAYLLIWGLFEFILETRWPAGLLIGY